MISSASERVRFGSFELNLRTGELISSAAAVAEGSALQKVLLRDQAFQILRILVQHPGEVISRDEIKRVLWPDYAIADFDRSINVAVAILRKAVGDTAENPKYIETLPRRGYRLKVPVESVLIEPLEGGEYVGENKVQKREVGRVGRSPRRRMIVAAALLTVLAAGAVSWRLHNRLTLAPSDTVVLADMDNQTGDSALGDGMNLALQVSLQQTPYLNLLGSDKVRETLPVLHVDEKSKITSQIALQVCRKTNSRAVISASIADIGNRFRVSVNAMDCQSGEVVEHVTNEAATRDDIVKVLGLSAFQLRKKLGESKDSLRKFNQPLDRATSSSPDALALLASGYKKQLSGDIASGLGDYGRALEIDPQFALVYTARGSGNHWLENVAQASSDFSKALELQTRLTIPARFQIESLYYGDSRHEWNKVYAIDEEWVRTFPRDVIARINFANCLRALGRLDEALVQNREAARLLPNDPMLIAHLITAIEAQHFDEAKGVYDEEISSGFDSPELHSDHALLAFLQGDTPSMHKEWAWASQDRVRGRFVLYVESKVEGFQGHARNAERLVRINAESSMKAGLSSYAVGVESEEALELTEYGDSEQAQLRAEDALSKSQDQETLMFAALTFARAGNARRAQKLVETINQHSTEDFAVHAYTLPCIRAAIKLSEKDPSAALTILQPVEPYDLAINEAFDYMYPAYLRGLAYLQLNQGALAANQFGKILDHSGVSAAFVTGSLSVLQLARAQELMDNTGAARKSYEEFLTLWKDADPDLPVYREAKAEYALLPHSQELLR